MHASHGFELGCGRRAGGLTAGREPFHLPGTEVRYAPDRVVDVLHTCLDVRLDPAVRRIEGVVRHRMAALTEDVASVTLHAKELEIEAVHDGEERALEFCHEGDEVHVELPRPLARGEEVEVRLRYRGAPRLGLYFVAPDEDYPDKPVQVWSQGQDEDSRYWFPCFDHPVEKATTEVRARVPAGKKALSNGALVGRETHGDGTETWHWRQAVPHSAYLVTLVVGDFEEVVLREAEPALVAWVPPGRRAQAERAFGRTARMMEVFEERFGLAYPYEKYAQVVVSDFVFGGMENTTATTLVEYALYDDRAALDYDADDLVAHELAHQWWGDLLTCRDWSHAWLNEGFATWSEKVFKEAHLGADEAARARFENLERYLEEDRAQYRRAIVDERYQEPIDLFDRHLYEKGGLVLHMLRQELGEQAFWDAIRAYARANQGRAVVTDDLRRAIEDSTGRNLEWFFAQWIFKAGHPELETSWRYDEQAGEVAITVKQVQKADDLTPEAHRIVLDLGVEDEQGWRMHRLDVRRREQTFHVQVSGRPRQVVPDPEGHLLGTVEEQAPPDRRRALLASTAPLMARIRAAQALAKDTSPDTVEALAAVLEDGFWGLAAVAAESLGKIRTDAARDALIHWLQRARHPKTRRAVAAALGAFRHDLEAARALRRVLEEGDESLFVEASAAKALGQTRAPFAIDELERALETRTSWAETVRAGAAAGLGATGRAEAIPLLLDATRRGRHVRIRQAAIQALGGLGAREARTAPVREALEDLLVDADFRVVVSAIQGLEALGDVAASGRLDAFADQALDGRVRRSARVAAARLKKRGERSPEVASLSDEVARLKARNADLEGRLERLERRLLPPKDAPAAPEGTPGA